MQKFLKRSLAWVLSNGILLSSPGWAFLSRLAHAQDGGQHPADSPLPPLPPPPPPGARVGDGQGGGPLPPFPPPSGAPDSGTTAPSADSGKSKKSRSAKSDEAPASSESEACGKEAVAKFFQAKAMADGPGGLGGLCTSSWPGTLDEKNVKDCVIQALILAHAAHGVGQWDIDDGALKLHKKSGENFAAIDGQNILNRMNPPFFSDADKEAYGSKKSDIGKLYESVIIPDGIPLPLAEQGKRPQIERACCEKYVDFAKAIESRVNKFLASDENNTFPKKKLGTPLTDRMLIPSNACGRGGDDESAAGGGGKSRSRRGVDMDGKTALGSGSGSMYDGKSALPLGHDGKDYKAASGDLNPPPADSGQSIWSKWWVWAIVAAAAAAIIAVIASQHKHKTTVAIPKKNPPPPPPATTTTGGAAATTSGTTTTTTTGTTGASSSATTTTTTNGGYLPGDNPGRQNTTGANTTTTGTATTGPSTTTGSTTTGGTTTTTTGATSTGGSRLTGGQIRIQSTQKSAKHVVSKGASVSSAAASSAPSKVIK